MTTANALVPMATCGSRMATIYRSSATARIDPPPPMSPRENPTTAPQVTASSNRMATAGGSTGLTWVSAG
jgi:hypothetical protein